MKAQELRIGNYIEQGVIFNILHNFGELGCLVHKNDFDSSLGDFIKQDELKPITLTEEWLLKFGFEKIGSYWHPKGSWHRYLFHGYVLNLEPEGGAVPHAQVHYIHQLQNLYFALTNTELICQK